MKICSYEYHDAKWIPVSQTTREVHENEVHLVFLFGDTEAVKNPEHFQYARTRYPNAIITGCSTAGNILGPLLSDAEMTMSLISFENGSSKVKLSRQEFDISSDFDSLAEDLLSPLRNDDLKHIFILSNGYNINGSVLTNSLNHKSNGITITGGLAGDGINFGQTYVYGNQEAQSNIVVAVGFYGDSLHVQSGCYSGWSDFGIERKVTRSEGNIVYEIDGEPALELYKKYLGENAQDLPHSGLRFPIKMQENPSKEPVIRTLLAIDETKNSVIFAGDVPQNSIIRLMKSDIDELINGAGKAAQMITPANSKPALGLAVSCVGRKIVLNKIIDDELEMVTDTLGENVILSGFYSYGEIAPTKTGSTDCQLHNQTMTLTTIYED